LKRASFVVEVRDDADRPVTNAVVSASFYESRAFGVETILRKEAKTLTEDDGKAKLSGLTSGLVVCGVQKKGYYDSTLEDIGFESAKLCTLQPWNKIYQCRLRKIGDPIPMYARAVGGDYSPSDRIPGFGENYGFDLIESDWVAPHGKGKVPDFLIRIDKKEVESPGGNYKADPRAQRRYDLKLSLQFSNPDDGIIHVSESLRAGSIFKLPRQAPDSGYKPILNSRNGYKNFETPDISFKETDSYLFRVRAERDEEGTLVAANYGKIRGPVEFGPTGWISFTYYLNPSSLDRNLEFDPKSNLLKGLSINNRVHSP
jgi:hypothetical protein